MKKYERFKTAIEPSIPAIWDEVGKTIRFGYEQETALDEEGEEITVYRGYNISLSGHMDYGHVKSEIIKHVYSDKDMAALINNALSALMVERAGIELDAGQLQDIEDYMHMNEWRDIAGAAAKELLNRYNQTAAE